MLYWATCGWLNDSRRHVSAVLCVRFLDRNGWVLHARLQHYAPANLVLHKFASPTPLRKHSNLALSLLTHPFTPATSRPSRLPLAIPPPSADIRPPFHKHTYTSSHLLCTNWSITATDFARIKCGWFPGVGSYCRKTREGRQEGYFGIRDAQKPIRLGFSSMCHSREW